MALGRIVTLLLLCSPLVLSSPKYVKGSAVALYSNKIGPYNNPSETYSFSHFTVGLLLLSLTFPRTFCVNLLPLSRRVKTWERC